jgi:hypothetical protein
MNLGHILEGWGKSMGLMEVDAETAIESERRMKICASCPVAKESSFLKLIKGSAEDMAAIYCSGCGCPVNEKSLVPDEQCPMGKWDK